MWPAAMAIRAPPSSGRRRPDHIGQVQHAGNRRAKVFDPDLVRQDRLADHASRRINEPVQQHGGAGRHDHGQRVEK